jgi:hypothetical protein
MAGHQLEESPMVSRPLYLQHCSAYVDTRLAASLKTGRCAKILRNLMVVFAAGIPQRVHGHSYLFDPEAICETIKLLEEGNASNVTKGPSRYKKGPLTGLYKKHFFQASFLADNILLEINRERLGIIYRKLSEHYGRGNYFGKAMEETDINLMVEAVVDDAIERRAVRGALTGEHLIYAKVPAGNIYLYASFHGEDPQRIADSVAVSLQDFPELAGIAPVFGETT